ncbi:MAG: hypothetical protein JSU98_10735 [Gemmatimonadales bacterium]|jgi:hypothetical protein|nr:MAG: hypothetical protein JSU98_10735 [Gemmatimonadales bacterium]
MRFAYIDSQGNEVTIPSVDALRLRIELGAIVDETVFHDANTGRWAPASEHEIYKTLQRELQDLESLAYAPPPPVPQGAGVDPPHEWRPVTPPRPAPQTQGDSVPEPSAANEVGQPQSGGADPVQPADPVEEVDPMEPAEPVEVVDPLMELDVAATESMDLDAADTESDEVSEPDPEPDLEAFGLGLELEVVTGFGEDATPTLASDRFPDAVEAEVDEILPPLEEAEGREADPTEVEMEAFEPLEGFRTEPELSGAWDDDGGESAPEPDPSLDDRVEALELEATPVDVTSEADGPPAPEMAYEAPAGPDDEDASPDWMVQESPADWASDRHDARPVEVPFVLDVGDSRRRARPQSAPPPRRLRRARTPGAGRVVMLVIAAVAVGVGGWYGWTYLLGGTEAGEGTSIEVLNLPEIPPELVPQMRQLSAAAVASTVGQLERLPERDEIPPAPADEWLAGRYLAGASEFASVQDYWRSVLRYLSAVEAADDNLFRQALEERIRSGNLSDENAGMIRRRAVAGWVAAAAERALVYRQLRAVATAALELHLFLLGNEDEIDYEPAAAGVSRDPVLEAVPANEALGVAMWERVGAVTKALDNLGYLETISTEGLLGAFLEQLAATPVL